MSLQKTPTCIFNEYLALTVYCNMLHSNYIGYQTLTTPVTGLQCKHTECLFYIVKGQFFHFTFTSPLFPLRCPVVCNIVGLTSLSTFSFSSFVPLSHRVISPTVPFFHFSYFSVLRSYPFFLQSTGNSFFF